LGSGVSLGCFLLGCKTVKQIFAFESTEDDYSSRMPKHNIRSVYRKKLDIHIGSPFDEAFQRRFLANHWDLVLLDKEVPYDDYLAYLRLVWPEVSQGGWLVMDRIYYHKPAGRALRDFCKTYNKYLPVIKSKYGVGLVCK